jgi:hypothetical protein
MNETPQSPGSPDELHNVAGVQKYAAELGRICTAISEDKELAQKVIDAVHSGSGANVERLFREAGVESRVLVEERKAPVDLEGGGGFAASSEEHTHVHVEVHVGPIDVVVDYDK